MAGYQQPCIHCGALIESDSRLCAACGSHSPFGYSCPACLAPTTKGQALCSGCGRALYVACPQCGGRTFAQEKCEICGASLMKRCENRRCGAPQFFENVKCTACGKKLRSVTERK